MDVERIMGGWKKSQKEEKLESCSINCRKNTKKQQQKKKILIEIIKKRSMIKRIRVRAK